MSLTPMMKQYQEIKAGNPDTLLLYRMGDFYETFGEDAVTASKLLGITLTARNHGGKDATPLAGFPYHALERYMPKLIASGLRVAVCEQVEDPATAKGVVKREVTEIVTRGTALSENYLDAKSNNYLAAVWPGSANGSNGSAAGEEIYGLSWLDLSTGEFRVAEGSSDAITGEIYRLNAQEILYPEALDVPSALREYRERERVPLTTLPKGYFHLDEGIAALQRQFKVASLEAFDCSHLPRALRAAAAALAYAKDSKKSELSHLTGLSASRLEGHMTLDAATVRNLEILKPLHGEDEHGTLFHLLDRTVTAMGGRALKQWLTHPLLEKAAIEARLDAVQELVGKPEALRALRAHLQGINDLERIVAKCGAGRVHARDLLGLGNSLIEAGKAGDLLAGLKSPLFAQQRGPLAGLSDKGARLAAHFTERPPLTVREGGMIREGAFPELDALNAGIHDGREWLNGLQQREKDATGIPSLKVGYNKVFGYYIEVTKLHEEKVPAHYMRKQSLTGAERYITPEMKDWENRILSAESGINALEYKLFCGLRDEVAQEAPALLAAARALAAIDVLQALAAAAVDLRFTRPEIAEDTGLRILGGRHPVVESLAEAGTYIANDVELDARDRQVVLVTGPNMAGKSTYLRQTGLIALLAQAGSFVPADFARVGLVDRIFTRVGASDRLARGQSTFMVEMIETASILRHATPRSLVLLDEIGRGTSTYDGLSLAWAITEALHENPAIAARTLFATHYHELTRLADRLPRLRNAQVTVREEGGKDGGEVIFLRKVVDGACDSSYGIQVARMAGVPDPVIRRANEILEELEEKGTVGVGIPKKRGAGNGEPRGKRFAPQVDLFSAQNPEKVLVENPIHRAAYDALMGLDVNGMTPMEALVKLSEIQRRGNP
ncbi:MAG TPA: DNA mismatch repair protein MutS [Fibrobacteria bacterium]|nr:DNA mismatch repair protein MutS [Fibrobacteria bacterium]